MNMKMLFLFFFAFMGFIESRQVTDALQQSSNDTYKAIQLRKDMGKPLCEDIYKTISSNETNKNLFQNAENMMLGTLPKIKDSKLEQPAEIIAINGNQKLDSLFYYSDSDTENISPSDILLVMRHGETAKTKNINPSQSGNPIIAESEKCCNLIREIIHLDAAIYQTSLYSSTTLRNKQTATAIAETKENVFTVPSLRELNLGILQEKNKADVLKNEDFRKAVCSLNEFPGAANTIANEILQFSAGLVKIFQHKKQNMGIAVANSAMMGVIIYNILSYTINNYNFFENIASCIPDNLDFFCLSYKPTDDGIVRFRIYDNRQVQQIFKNTNLEKYLSPSNKAKASINGTNDGIFLQKIKFLEYRKNKNGC